MCLVTLFEVRHFFMLFIKCMHLISVQSWIYPAASSLFNNPLTPGAFCQKCIFWTIWWFSCWISAKLALISSKMHLQHAGLPFLPLASRFTTFWLGRAQKWKLLTREWPTSLGFSTFAFFSSSFLFLLFFSLCCSNWPSTGVACS